MTKGNRDNLLVRMIKPGIGKNLVERENSTGQSV